LKPLGESAASGNIQPLRKELYSLKNKIEDSELYRHLHERYDNNLDKKINLNSLKVDFISEKALIYLFAEQNLITEDLLLKLVEELGLDRRYMEKTLSDNRRRINLDQRLLL
jgi:thymidine kinase